MIRAELLVRLKQADRGITESHAYAEKQRRLLEQLIGDGQDTMATAAAEILATFEQTLATHIADRRRILKYLAENPN